MAEQVKTRRQLQGVVVSDKMDKTITVGKLELIRLIRSTEKEFNTVKV